MLYCNAGPIASACSLDREATQSAMNALIQSIIDCTNLGFDLNLDFGVAVLRIRNKNLKTVFKPEFSQAIQQTTFQQKVTKKTNN